MWWIVSIATALHFVTSVMPGSEKLKERGIDVELFRQHHEKCVMVGLVALAILHPFR